VRRSPECPTVGAAGVVRVGLPVPLAVLTEDASTVDPLPRVERLRPGLWTIPVPLPNTSLRYVFADVFETSKGAYLVDARVEHRRGATPRWARRWRTCGSWSGGVCWWSIPVSRLSGS
jgi:hypothetical protein